MLDSEFAGPAHALSQARPNLLCLIFSVPKEIPDLATYGFMHCPAVEPFSGPVPVKNFAVQVCRDHGLLDGVKDPCLEADGLLGAPALSDVAHDAQHLISVTPDDPAFKPALVSLYLQAIFK